MRTIGTLSFILAVLWFGKVPACADETKDQMISNLRAIHNEVSGTLAKATDDPTTPVLDTQQRLLELQKQIAQITKEAGEQNLAIGRRYSKFDNDLTRLVEAASFLYDEASSVSNFLDDRDGLYSSVAKDADSLVERLEP